MTRKELYYLSVKLSGQVLRDFFEASSISFTDMESNASRKKARKNLYEALAPLLVKEL